MFVIITAITIIIIPAAWEWPWPKQFLRRQRKGFSPRFMKSGADTACCSNLTARQESTMRPATMGLVQLLFGGFTPPPALKKNRRPGSHDFPRSSLELRCSSRQISRWLLLTVGHLSISGSHRPSGIHRSSYMFLWLLCFWWVFWMFWVVLGLLKSFHSAFASPCFQTVWVAKGSQTLHPSKRDIPHP